MEEVAEEYVPHTYHWQGWLGHWRCRDCTYIYKRGVNNGTVPSCPLEKTDWTEWYKDHRQEVAQEW